MNVPLIALLTAELIKGQVMGTDSDVPMLDPEQPSVVTVSGGTVTLRTGESVQTGEGVFMNAPAAIAIAQDMAQAEAENAALRAEIDKLAQRGEGVPLFVVITIALLAASAAGGAVVLLKK